MENPEEPNNHIENNEEDDPKENNHNHDHLSLSLAPYSERCVRAKITPPPPPLSLPIDSGIPLNASPQLPLDHHLPMIEPPLIPPQPLLLPIESGIAINASSQLPLDYHLPPLLPPPELLTPAVSDIGLHAPLPNLEISPPIEVTQDAPQHHDELPRARQANNNNDETIIIVPPFPWSTDRPAKVHTIDHLVQNKIFIITGEVQCGSCHRKFEMSFELMSKFREVMSFMKAHRDTMFSRAPKQWKQPVLPKCEHCNVENSIRPIIGDSKDHSVNWLFLFLGQLLGLCTLDHLRYFCSHNSMHCSGAKDRVLYQTYNLLKEQLLEKP